MARKLNGEAVLSEEGLGTLKNHTVHEALNRTGTYLTIAFNAPAGKQLKRLAQDAMQDRLNGITRSDLRQVFAQAREAAVSEPLQGWSSDDKLGWELGLLEARIVKPGKHWEAPVTGK